MGDADAPALQAHGLRRDRERARLLPVHVPLGDPAPLRRHRGPPRRGVRDVRAMAIAAHRPHRQLDWRRSRRPPARDARRPALRSEAAVPRGIRLLPRAGSLPRRRAPALDAPRAHLAAAERPGGGVARSVRAAPRRAVSARARGHLRAPRGHGGAPQRAAGAAASGDEGQAVPERDGVRDGPRDHQLVARRESRERRPRGAVSGT